MNHFTPTELQRMQDAQDGAMQDQCVILGYVTGERSPYNTPNEEWVEAGSSVCGVKEGSRSEVMDGTEVVLADAELRLPIDTSIDRRDRIQVTHRYGVAVEPVTYEIIGKPRRGPSGLQLMLREVTDG